MSLTDLLITDCVIQRNAATTKSSYGNKLENWQPIATVKCRVSSIPGNSGYREHVVNKQVLVSTHIIYMGVTDVTESDRLFIKNETYDVMYVRNPGNMNHHLEIDARLVRG